MVEKLKNRILDSVIPLFLFLLGALSLVYPALSSWYNTRHQSIAVETYTEQTAELTAEESDALLSSAREYNKNLGELEFPFSDYGEFSQQYDSALNFENNGVMGHIVIDMIHVDLPIFHGSDASTLDKGAGHLEGSSLPVGGIGTHSVITAHRGLPAAKLFTDLDKLQEGNVFEIQILEDTLYYEVDQIRTVKPDELEYLSVESDKDLCTLMTCTPYGINTERLLVRGHRIEKNQIQDVSGDATQMDSLILAPFTALPILLICLIAYLTSKNNKIHLAESHEERMQKLENELRLLSTAQNTNNTLPPMHETHLQQLEQELRMLAVNREFDSGQTETVKWEFSQETHEEKMEKLEMELRQFVLSHETVLDDDKVPSKKKDAFSFSARKKNKSLKTLNI